ncbi:MAG TPA: S9 family peptidase [Phycisphaerales bacterium]
MRRVLSFICVALLALPALAGPDPLLPRALLFGNPARTAPQLSPDGTHLSFLAPVEGVLNIFVGPAANPAAATPITSDRSRGIRRYFWSFDSKSVLYLQDREGDEGWQLYAVDLAAKGAANATPRALTAADPIQGADGRPILLPSGKPMRPTVMVVATSPREPNALLVGINDRDPQFHDVYRVAVATGQRQLVYKNTTYAEVIADNSLKVRIGARFDTDGAKVLELLDDPDQPKPLARFDPDDSETSFVLGFDPSGDRIYLSDSRDRNTAALFLLDLNTGEKRLLASDPRVDFQGALINPRTAELEAAEFIHARSKWTVLRPDLTPDFETLNSQLEGDFRVQSRALDDSAWLIAETRDNAPMTFHLYSRPAPIPAAAGELKRPPGTLRFLFSARPDLDAKPLARMHPQTIRTRDGLEMVSYLSLPPWLDADHNARPEYPIPTVLLVHGGPWTRDEWGFRSYHQWLTNRGYAVLAVNFRGSTGFGKSFLNAGDREWGAKMLDDLIDACEWAKREQIALPDKIAIMGGSYGGYATLAGLSMRPDYFAAGVSIVGPSNLVTLLNSIPPYWAPAIERFARSVGDHRTDEGRAFLLARSPLTHADKIIRPLLIGQGANDPRVKQAESDQMVEALRKRNVAVTYVLFPDEGHGFARPHNSMAFFAIAEAFLSTHLGGRAESIDNAITPSSATVPVGRSQIPGLREALGGEEARR